MKTKSLIIMLIIFGSSTSIFSKDEEPIIFPDWTHTSVRSINASLHRPYEVDARYYRVPFSKITGTFHIYIFDDALRLIINKVKPNEYDFDGLGLLTTKENIVVYGNPSIIFNQKDTFSFRIPSEKVLFETGPYEPIVQLSTVQNYIEHGSSERVIKTIFDDDVKAKKVIEKFFKGSTENRNENFRYKEIFGYRPENILSENAIWLLFTPAASS